MPLHERSDERLDKIGTRDHALTSEYRIFGPPGTGKTTNLIRQIRRAVDRFGLNSVMVTSFSRAAAAELVGRNVPLDSDLIGTLHSRCFHALGRPNIAEVHADHWNRENPHLKITPVSKNRRMEGEEAIEDFESLRNGDRLLQQLNRCRGVMLPMQEWSPEVLEFAAKWTQYKSAYGFMDFSDLIETALRDLPLAPGNPSVIVADEAQDFNKMLFTLLRQWGHNAEYFVLAGDDDQTIYAWAGASPEAILDPEIPEDHKIFLQQSERVPRAIHGVSENLIRQVSRRQQKSYLPRPEDGEVIRLSSGGYSSPEYFLLKSLERHLKAGKSIMFLGACSYMLQPIVAVLRKNGIPFHNPYRKSNGFWNQLRVSSRQSAANRILALLVAHRGFGDGHRDWINAEVSLWAEWLRPGYVLRPGFKSALAVVPAQRPASPETLQRVLESSAFASLMEAMNQGIDALLGWWLARLAPELRKRVHFPASVAEMRSAQALRTTPRVVVGTIHSVKGGQADVVYLFPDLSRAGDALYRQRGPAQDSVIRTFYVGATRARESLYICSAEGAMAVRI